LSTALAVNTTVPTAAAVPANATDLGDVPLVALAGNTVENPATLGVTVPPVPCDTVNVSGCNTFASDADNVNASEFPNSVSTI
jgi:hypothetical protein